jgi:hypothetical protein
VLAFNFKKRLWNSSYNKNIFSSFFFNIWIKYNMNDTIKHILGQINATSIFACSKFFFHNPVYSKWNIFLLNIQASFPSSSILQRPFTMAARRVTKSAVDWVALQSKVPSKQTDAYRVLKSHSDKYISRYVRRIWQFIQGFSYLKYSYLI